MRLSNRFAARGAMVIALTGLLACSDNAHDQKAAAPAEQPVRGGTLVIAAPSDLEPTSPLSAVEAFTQEVHRHLLFMTLLRNDDSGALVPYLAKSWELDGDTAVTFHLRNDVRWHDGVATTAEDVAFTFALAKQPETAYPNAGYIEAWKSVSAIDSFTLRVSFEAVGEPLTGWAYLPILPKHIYRDIKAANLRDAAANKRAVGNGPFRFVSAAAGDRVTFEANPDFPAELGGAPFVQRVVWRVIPDRQAQITEIRTRQADVILSPPAEQLAKLDADPELKAVLRPTNKYVFVGWNGKRAPFDQARVRHALALAINRADILQVLRSGYGELATSPVPPSHWGYDKSLRPLPYDSAQARSLLAQAGYTDRNGDGRIEDANGKALRFEIAVPAQVDFSRSIAVMIVDQLKRLGIEARVKQTEFNTLIEDISSPERRFDAVIMAWETDPQLDLRDVFHSSNIDGPFQLASYRNAGVDSILTQLATISDHAAATPLWHRVQSILRDDQPWTVLYYSPDLILTRERVRGIRATADGTFANLPRWWLAGAE